jgi:hypothetical protein
VHCPYVARVVGDMMQVLTDVPGVFMAPTRRITANISQMKSWGYKLTAADIAASPCPFADAVHPALPCYIPIVVSIAMTVDEAIRVMNASRRKALAGCPSAGDASVPVALSPPSVYTDAIPDAKPFTARAPTDAVNAPTWLGVSESEALPASRNQAEVSHPIDSVDVLLLLCFSAALLVVHRCYLSGESITQIPNVTE